jgi:hypothetical protein
MLGLLVFPHQKGFDSSIDTLPLSQLYSEGWPKITVSLGHCKTLGKLLWHMRNAAAHRRIVFSSDSSDSLQEVIIELSDKPLSRPINWRAQVTAQDLRGFAFKLIDLLEEFERSGRIGTKKAD